jgi:hypothetical protein
VNPPVEITRNYLRSYTSLLLAIRQNSNCDDPIKGKQVVQFAQQFLPKQHVKSVDLATWDALSPGWVALSIGGSYIKSDNNAGAGMILRDDTGRCFIIGLEEATFLF